MALRQASLKKGGLARARFMRQTCLMKKEFVFQIEQDEDMLVATCHEPEMATQGENLDEVLAMIRDLVRCRFDEGDERLAWPIRLHFLHDPVLSAQVS
jgi:predicted RNase H-like HicB family nuclease